MTFFLGSYSTVADILRSLFKPIIKFCLRHGLRIQEVSTAIREIFVQCAQEELAKRGESINPSKISAITGIRRQDITPLAEIVSKEFGKNVEEDLHLALTAPTRSKGSIFAKVLGIWSTKKNYLDKKQNPRLLTCEGSSNEFKDLVAEVSTDLSPYTVLNELEHLGIVVRENNFLKLLRSAYEPKEGALYGLGILIDDLDSLIQAVDENIFAKPKVKNLHIQTNFDNIPLVHIEKIKRWLIDQGNLFHEKARRYISEHDRDVNPLIDNKNEINRGRITVTTFGFSEILEKGEKN